ncbi:zf-CCCH domain-containing protein [Rhizoctonia solani AG-1 IA]|uniref:Zf-CCCH domain-containing protein n=1 Tax=Thanatephorus cucumeris (strain AG1-IA) TaxID=983506 RepID=L8WLH6_THACA|nr:zf-CCCH domain-containing protein [Rhizoctonia solani AG-1 IA]
MGGIPANAPNPHMRPPNSDPHVNPRVNSLTGRPRPRFPPGSRIMGIGVPKRSKLSEGEAEVEMKRTVCRFYSSGMCEYGKDCRFLHVVPEPADQVQASPKSTSTLCRNYPGCAYGDRCDFKHVEVNGVRPADSPFSTASALPPSVSARASPAIVSRPLAAEPTPIPDQVWWENARRERN